MNEQIDLRATCEKYVDKQLATMYEHGQKPVSPEQRTEAVEKVLEVTVKARRRRKIQCQ